MSGFKNEINNIDFEKNLLSIIAIHISQCCEEMRKDCKENNSDKLFNHEDKISNRLVEQYLDLSYLGLKFVPQMPSCYDSTTDTYKSRTDISIISIDLLKNREVYYIIESKRLDGGKSLNRKYVSDGISRFVLPPPKYPSCHKKNIMLGYIVKTINVSDNVDKIDKLQRDLLIGVTIGEMNLVYDDGKGFSHYRCMYQANSVLEVELAHLFYDFSDVIRKKA